MIGFVLGLGSALGLGVVMEGVETRDTWEWLHDLGCPAIQGYYVRRPEPADEFSAWLRGAAFPRPIEYTRETR